MSQTPNPCGCERCNLCAVWAASNGAPWSDPYRRKATDDAPPPAPKPPPPAAQPTLFSD